MAYACEVMFKTDCGQFSAKVFKWSTNLSQVNYVARGYINIPLFEEGVNVYVPNSSLVYFKEVTA